MTSVYYVFTTPLRPDKARSARDHQLGLLLLAHALRNAFDLPFANDPETQICEGPHGKPYLPDMPGIHFNISHCPGLVMCGVDTSPIGVDCEQIRPFTSAIVRRVLTPEEQLILKRCGTDKAAQEQTFTRFWTLKESWIKHSGIGLTFPLTEIAFDLPAQKEKVRIQSSEPDLYFSQIVTGRHVLSVCSECVDLPAFHEVPADQFSIA